MPTWPTGVQTVTLVFGKGITIGGNLTSSRLTVEPVFNGTNSIVWSADGTPILPFSEDASADEGSYGSVAIPAVDQTGFLDDGQHAFTMWGYKLTETPMYGRRPGTPRVKYWQPVVGQTTVDFDLIPNGALGLPVAGPLAVVTSVNGQVGAVTIAGADGAPDAAVAARITDAASQTRAALSATYLPLPTGTKITGYAPIVQADGSIAWAAQSAATSNVGLDIDGIPYFSIGASGATIAADTDGIPFFSAA